MFNRWERIYIEIVTGKRNGFAAVCARKFLYLLSCFYKLATTIRNYAYDSGWLRCYFAPVPVVVSVGNIVAGGTGKTPVVMKIIRDFNRPVHKAILTRGYRSPAERLPKPTVLSKGNGPEYPASYCGDEPYLLSLNLPQTQIYVGKYRQWSAVMAAKADAKLIVLDDGMQYRSLARDFDVVVVDAEDPLGQDYLLPRGFLRESLEGLARADLIILNHVYDHPQFLSAKHKLARYTIAPIIGMHPVPSTFKDLAGLAAPPMKGVKAGVFCGIAKPAHFLELLRKEGVEPVAELCCADHFLPPTLELQKFAEECEKKGATCLICTEKDRVKLAEVSSGFVLPIYWLPIDLVIIEGEEIWEQFLNQMREKIDRDLSLSEK